MKIRFNTLCVGPLFCFQPGEVAELSRETAAPILAGGYAVLVVDPAAPVVEAAEARPAPETATVKSVNRRK